jgi:AmpD protein
LIFAGFSDRDSGRAASIFETIIDLPTVHAVPQVPYFCGTLHTVMIIDPQTGLLDIARQLPSPNCDARSAGTELKLIVVHNISLPPGQFEGDAIDRLFTNSLDPTEHEYFAAIAGLKVSAHLLIRRDGGIVQYVPFQRRAWHAGESCYRGRVACNDFSVGIELEGTDETPYTEEQYSRLSKVVACLIRTYPTLSAEHIVGHCDIAPGRKTDPGPSFRWDYFSSMLAKQL